MKGLVFDTENQMQFKDFGEPLLDNLQKEVGGCIEVVHPKYLPEGLCMQTCTTVPALNQKR